MKAQNIPSPYTEILKAMAAHQKFVQRIVQAAKIPIELEQLRKIQESVSKLAEVAQSSFNRLPESVKQLAEIGWYVPMDMNFPDINYFGELINERKLEIIDRELIEYFNLEIDSIESDLVVRYPKRASAISSAIKAHRNKDYYLSIPVFYTQVEGICKEITGYRFFKLRHGEPLTAKIVEAQIDSITSVLLEPLKYRGQTREKQNIDLPIGINRHDILHGDSTDYGENPVNSYKAFSLLTYIGLTLEQLLEKK